MCRAEAPHLSQFQKQYANKGLVVLAVNADNDPKDRIQQFVEAKKLEQPILLMGNGVAVGKYHIRGFPTLYWIDRKGKIIARKRGFRRGDEKELESTLRRLLKGGEH